MMLPLSLPERLSHAVKNTRREVSIDYIQKVFGILSNGCGNPAIQNTQASHSSARQLAMYFAKKFTKALASIGSQIGKDEQRHTPARRLIIYHLQTTICKYVEDLNKKLTL